MAQPDPPTSPAQPGPAQHPSARPVYGHHVWRTEAEARSNQRWQRLAQLGNLLALLGLLTARVATARATCPPDQPAIAPLATAGHPPAR